MTKQAYEIYRGVLEEIRAAGAFKQERSITTPQGAREDTTTSNRPVMSSGAIPTG